MLVLSQNCILIDMVIKKGMAFTYMMSLPTQLFVHFRY